MTIEYVIWLYEINSCNVIGGKQSELFFSRAVSSPIKVSFNDTTFHKVLKIANFLLLMVLFACASPGEAPLLIS